MRWIVSLVVCVCVSAIPGVAAEPPDVAWCVSSEDMTNTLTAQSPLPWRNRAAKKDVLVEVDDTKTFQSILGLGSSLEHATCYNISRLDPARQAEVIERIVNPSTGIGMNLMRICIGTSDFTGDPWYSYDDVPQGETDPELTRFSIDKDRAYLLPILKLAREKNPDLLFFASPWSPPAWMKEGGNGMCGGVLKPEWYGVYARYLAKFVQAYEAEGIPIHAMTLQNEPGVNWDAYPSCEWTGEQQRDFIRDHVGPVFRELGIQPRLWCFDHNFNNLGFPRAVLSDAGAAQFVEGTAFHHYEGKPDAMTQLKQEFPNKDIFFSEGSTFATRGALQIISFLRNGARSYNAWVTVLDQNRKPNNGPHSASATCIVLNTSDMSLEYRFDYYMYGQFMKYIPRGSVRIDSSEGTRRLNNVAFRTPDGTIVVVVANAESSSQPIAVRWNGRVIRTELPSKSVATLQWPSGKG